MFSTGLFAKTFILNVNKSNPRKSKCLIISELYQLELNKTLTICLADHKSRITIFLFNLAPAFIIQMYLQPTFFEQKDV